MKCENLVAISGRLTKDPESRYTRDGKLVVSFSLANNVGYGDKEKTYFFEVSIWGKTAEHFAANIVKGDEVYIRGILQQQTWEDDRGKKHEKVKILGLDVKYLHWKRTEDSGGKKSSGKPQAQGNNAPPPDDDIPF